MVEDTTMTLVVWTYIVYMTLSVGLAVWVGRTLHKNGRVFLVETFDGREGVADSVNHLLLVGFYLINIGFVSIALKYGTAPTDSGDAILFLTTKVGAVLIVLGAMHFLNMAVLIAMPKSSLFQSLAPGNKADGGDKVPV